jgi:flagellar L-ring protein precursor FlgH
MRWIAAIVIGGAVLLQTTTGLADSLWKDGGRGSLFTDVRAGRVGDLVTVLVTEDASSDRKAETNLKKDSTNSFSIANFFGNEHFGAAKEKNRAQFDFSGNNEQKANGNITRTDRVTAQIPARVIKVLDGGLLLVEGRRAIVVNDETQILAFSGIIRPDDIGPDNTVRSTQVADAEITMEGKGVLAEKQRPGILQRLFDIFRVF